MFIQFPADATICAPEVEPDVYLAAKAFVSRDLCGAHERSAGMTRRFSSSLMLPLNNGG
jgi:hypothetical protein